jgi:epoxide hydrolase-like predicted phosphatase
MAIRAVIFDFGGVLYFTPSLAWARRWQAVMGLKEDPFIAAILSSPEESEYVNNVMTGKIPESQVWEMVARRWRINPAIFNRFRRGALSGRRWNKQLARFVESLRPRYKTAILSNAGSDARRTFSEVYKIDRLVDDVIISAEEKVAKPDERIYRITVDRLGVRPEEAVFVDDLLPNVEAARQFGMQGVHFLNTAQAIAAVQGYLG